MLTEFSAIATWLARTSRDRNLLPTDAEGEARAIEVLAYVEGTIHGQGFARIIKPSMFEPQDVVHGTLGLGKGSVKQQGRKVAEQGFAILDPQLGRHPFASGEAFTVADAALFHVERWAPQLGLALPVNVAAHEGPPRRQGGDGAVGRNLAEPPAGAPQAPRPAPDAKALNVISV